MSVWQLDENHDWTFGRPLLTGKPAVAQNIKTRLLEWKGDCFWNVEAGIDYARFLTKDSVEDLIFEVKKIIFGTRGVSKILDLQYEIVDRKFIIKSCTVELISLDKNQPEQINLNLEI